MLQGDVGLGEILFCEQKRRSRVAVAMSHDDIVEHVP